MKSILLIFFVALSSFCFAQTAVDSVKVPENQKVIKKAYTLTVPSTWRIDNECREEICSIFSPADTLGEAYDRFVENINITVNKLNNPAYTVDQYAAYSIKYLPSVVKNFVVVDKKKLRSNAYRVTYKGEKSNYNQTWRQYYYIKNSKVYIITFACESIKYAYYLPLIEPYLNSFVLH